MSHERTRELTESLLASFNRDEWIMAREVSVRGCDGRVDVLAVRRSQFKQKQVRAYEIKVSRADFLADVGRQKWRKYLSVCHQVYFAAPAGIIRKEEVPHGAGLIVLGVKGWQVVKSAQVHEPDALDADAVLSMLFACEREMQAERDALARREALRTLEGVSKEIGGEIARRLAGASPSVERDAERIINEVRRYFGETYDAIQAIRFAGSLATHRNVLERVGMFLSELTTGDGDAEMTGRRVTKGISFLRSRSAPVSEKSTVNV